MYVILFGAGGGSCQMCKSTDYDLKDRKLVIQGFPTDRSITDADEFFTLPSNTNFNSPINQFQGLILILHLYSILVLAYLFKLLTN